MIINKSWIILYLSFWLLLISCKPKIIFETKEVRCLSASSILKPDSVKNFIEQYGNSNSEIAESYFNQIQQYQNTNINKAIFLAIRAITLYPTKEHYIELARLYSKTEQYDEQSSVLRLLTMKQYYLIDKFRDEEYVFDKPADELIYESIVSCLLSKQIDIYGFEIQTNNIVERLRNDKRMEHLKNTELFNNVILQFLPENELGKYLKKSENFNAIIKQVKDSNSVFKIEESNIFNYNYNQAIDFEMGNSANILQMYYTHERKKDSVNWLNFNMKYAFKLNNNITVLCYAVDTSEKACPKELRCIYYRIVTYNSNIDLVDSKVIAFVAGEKMATVDFNRNIFSTTFYNRIFKKSYHKNDFDNDLLEVNKVSVEKYQIENTGKIVRI